MAISILRESDDKLAESRISLGTNNYGGMYMVFRGDPEKTLHLLRTALRAAEEALPVGRYIDRRDP